MNKYKHLATDVGERFRSGTNGLVKQGRKDFNIPPIISERIISTKWANDNNFSNFAAINTPRMFHSRLAGFYDSSDLEEEHLADLSGSALPGRVDSAAYRSFLKLESKSNFVDPGYSMKKSDFEDSLYNSFNQEGYDNKNSERGRIQMIDSFINTDENIDRKDELFINVIQPGVYSINDVTESVGNNFGINESRSNRKISLVQAPETEQEKMKRLSIRNTIQPPAVEDVFDPRNSSYGPSYRRYFEPNSGEVRYFYDDINAVKMPNYITRNHLDMFSFADTTGAQRQASVNGLGSVREMAEETWHNSQINFRTDLQTSLLQKVNSQAWQRRIAPIRTH